MNNKSLLKGYIMNSITSKSPLINTASDPSDDSEIIIVSSKTSLYQRISTAYTNMIHKFIQFLKKHNWFVTSMVLGTFLIEPWQAIKAGFMNPTSWKKHFNYYNMNPIVLTEGQSKQQPILLIHGNYHNQSAWISLAKKLKLSYFGPVYTVNLPNGSITQKDFEIVQKKIEQIKSQYKQFNVNDIKINLVGHSRGGAVANLIAWTTCRENKLFWNRSNDIGKIIKIGSVLDQEEVNEHNNRYSDFNERVYEITSKFDVLETDQSLCPLNHTEIVNSGHLGLLSSTKTHERIIQWLS